MIQTPYLRDADSNVMAFPARFYVRAESLSRRSEIVPLPYSDRSADVSDGCFNPRRVDVSGILHAEDEETARALVDAVNAFSYRRGLELWFKGRRIRVDRLAEYSVEDSGRKGFLYRVSFGFLAADPFWYSEEKTVVRPISWARYKPVTIANPKSQEVTNVPVCIRIADDSDIGAVCRSDGYDVRFFDSDWTELSQCRLSFSVSSGKASGEFWVLIPELPAAGKTIYCAYGDPDASDVSDPDVNPNILTNSDFELWNTPTDLVDWVEWKAGSSTINQEATEKTRGDYSVRFDVDSNGSGVSIRQNIPLAKIGSGKRFCICLKAKKSVEATNALYILFVVYVGSTPYYYNFSSDTWETVSRYWNFSLATNFQKFSESYDGTLPEGADLVQLHVAKFIATSSSLYFDDLVFLKADSYDACDIADASWYEQGSIVSWGPEQDMGSFQVEGTARTFPRIRVVMAGAASELSVTVNGRVCQFSAPLAVNDVLEIDSYRGRVTRNGADGASLFGGLFPALDPGENTIEVQGGPCRVEVIYSEAYF